MDIICPHTGELVEARGILQITKCYHPEVTDEQAYNPIFALEWGIPQMKDKEHCKNKWTTCRWYYE